MADKNRPEFLVPQRGMIWDRFHGMAQEGYYCYAFNFIPIGLDGDKNPIGKNVGSTLLNIAFAPGYKVVGFRRIPELRRTLFMLHNPFEVNPDSPTGKGVSAIAEVLDYNCVSGSRNHVSTGSCGCDNYKAIESMPLETMIPKPCNSYRIIKTATCFNFSLNYPVDIEHDYVNCELRIYFTDKYNERRFLYMKVDGANELYILPEFHVVTGFDACNAPIYGAALDCNKIKIQPDIDPRCIIYNGEIPGGNLSAGVYQFFVALATSNGQAMTKYSVASNEIPLFSRQITNETDYKTGYGIALEITGLAYSTIHKYYNLAVAITVDNVTRYELIATLPISTTKYNYTGFDVAAEVLTENDVLQRFGYYKTAESVTQANGHLLWSGMTEYSKGNWQRVANLIKVGWQTTQMPLGYYGKSLYAHKYRTYPRDEVVSLGIIFGFTNEEESNPLHIPGRALKAGEDAVINNSDAVNIPNCYQDENINRHWNVYNTASITETPHQLFVECEDTIWEKGEFGYWESSQRYPNDYSKWGDLCNQPIRHHKMPSCKISPIHDHPAFPDDNMIYPIGIYIDHVSVYNAIETCLQQGLITPEQKSRLRYYRIVRGNRVGNKSIIAKGLFYDVNTMVTRDTSNQANFQSQTYLYPNYGFNDLRDDPYISSDYGTYQLPDSPITNYKTPFVRSGRYTFHSPDTHFRNPGIGDFMALESLEHGHANVHFREMKDHAKFKFLTTLSYALSLITGGSFAMSDMNKESKTQNRKDYWYNTNDDTDTYNLKRQEVYSDIAGGGAATAWSIYTSQGTAYNLNTDGTVKKEADWNVGKKKSGASGNTLNISGTSTVTDYQDLLKNNGVNYLSEETFNQTTADKYDLIPNPGASNLYKQGLIYGEKQKINPLFAAAIGTGLTRITTLMTMSLVEMKKIIDLIESLIPLYNQAVQYQAVGRYNKSSFVNVVAGNIRRYVLDHAYLSPEIQSFEERLSPASPATTTVKMNNWRRETSLYVKHHGAFFTAPDVQDVSKVTMSDLGFNELTGHTYDRVISSYYGSIRRYVPDQYGSIYDISYVETGHCPFFYNQENPVTYAIAVFGGDTFINKFGLKRKHQFFTLTAYGMPHESDWFYEQYPNVGYPNYYFNTKIPIGSRLKAQGGIDFQTLITPLGASATLQNLFGVPKNRLDLAPSLSGGIGVYASNPGELFYQKGYIYTSMYSIPLFVVESDVNLDFRHGVDNGAGDFYPRQKDLDYWLQEKNVPLKEDNQYHYNSTYSKQNRFMLLTSDGPDFVPNDACAVDRPNEVIYSQPRNMGDKYDPWLVYYPLNRYVFDNQRGRLIGVDGIEGDKLLCRFENGMAIHNAYVTIQTSVETAIMGTGGMFQSKPQEFLRTDLGYLGSQHKALINTDIGHIWCDCIRGAIWVLPPGGGMPTDLAGPQFGMESFFRSNLPFQILQDFPEMSYADIDNALKGIGIAMVEDKRLRHIFITKLDYKCINSLVKWDSAVKTFYIDGEVLNQRIKVDIHDKRYFCDKSWTIGFYYDREKGMYWSSFYGFKPNFYIPFNRHFQSGLNSYELSNSRSTVWDHNLTNKSFQVIYGRLQPFEIDLMPKTDLQYSVLKSVGFKLDVWRFHNENDRFHVENVCFNKAMVWNERQCSGILYLNPQTGLDMSLTYPWIDYDNNGIQIRVQKDSGVWYFNEFSDRIKALDNNIPIMLHNCANNRTYLNLMAIELNNGINSHNPIRSDQSRVRLCNDKYSNYEFVLRWLYQDKTIQ